MKKKIISIFLMLAMVLSLAGCGSDQKALIGRWEADIDCAQALEGEIKNSLEEELLPYFQLSSFQMKVVLTFREDGTYEMTVDEASLQTAAKIFRQDMENIVESYMKDVVAAEGIDWEDFLSMAGGSMEDLMAELLTDEDMDEMVQEVIEGVFRSGKYKAVSGKLFLTDSASEDISDSMYDEYVLEGSTLTLVTSTEDMDDFSASLHPMAFHRV